MTTSEKITGIVREGGRDHFTDFDLDAPDFADDYEEVLGKLVSGCPVAHSEVAGGYYVVSRYDDVRACAQDWETFSSEGGFEPGRADTGAKLYPVELDPPYQTRWRTALGPYFSPRAVRTRTDSVREQATVLLDGFVEKGEAEFVEAFAAHLPGRVFFGTFLGVPFEELPYIQQATDDAMRGPMDGRAEAWGKVATFLDDYLTQRENETARGDFVDAVVTGVEDHDGKPCSREHKIFVLTDLLAGGIGTTTYMLAGIVHHLATHPEDAQRLRDDPSLRPRAVEEIIRYYASIVALGRTATKDTEVAGTEIKEGDFLMLSFSAAARDPQVFENPHEVDIDREIALNPAFSFGPHRCIGSHVARLMGTVALDEILRRLPDVRLAEGFEPRYSNSSIARNMDSLEIVFTPGSREHA